MSKEEALPALELIERGRPDEDFSIRCVNPVSSTMQSR